MWFARNYINGHSSLLGIAISREASGIPVHQHSRFTMRSLIVSSALVAGALAQSEAYAQCGGTSWTGDTTCVSGYTCTYQSDYYSQCLPGTASTTLATSTTADTSTTAVAASTTAASTTAASTTSSAAAASGTGFKWLGVDESGAEFGTDVYPGVWGTNFIFPDNSSIQVC